MKQPKACSLKCYSAKPLIINTTVAGVDLAAAFGVHSFHAQRPASSSIFDGIYHGPCSPKLISTPFWMNFKHRKKRSLPLTEKQWHEAFEIRSGHLVNVKKLVKKIRYGGIDPSIRTYVWPFLLGLYHLDSTHEERELERIRKKQEFVDLRRQCMLLLEEASNQSRQTEEIEDGYVDIMPLKLHPQEQLKKSNEEASCTLSCKDDRTLVMIEKDERFVYEIDFSVREELRLDNGSLRWDDSMCGGEVTIQTTEEFVTWQRIIRLDAIRMNAEWAPFSPFQANVTKETASELARAVHLRNHEHLDPCMQHHAARVVAILEAYAMYDQETGYCQGMSDLLSPFVAILDDDYEAFWCFVHFMYTVRENFRLDETGIQRQLSMLSRILKLSDPHFYNYLETIHAEDCTFVYRMIVVLLRRELSFEQTMSLWEVIWADKVAVRWGTGKNSWRKKRRDTLPSDDLLLYVIAAAIRGKRKLIMENCKGMDDMLRECNAMAGTLDIWALLDDARDLMNILHGKMNN